MQRPILMESSLELKTELNVIARPLGCIVRLVAMLASKLWRKIPTIERNS